jgi:hypothetical protein
VKEKGETWRDKIIKHNQELQLGERLILALDKLESYQEYKKNKTLTFQGREKGTR